MAHSSEKSSFQSTFVSLRGSEDFEKSYSNYLTFAWNIGTQKYGFKIQSKKPKKDDKNSGRKK